MTLLIELGVQIAADGGRRLPEWGLGVQCPHCDSTDVAADPARLLTRACSAGGC